MNSRSRDMTLQERWYKFLCAAGFHKPKYIKTVSDGKWHCIIYKCKRCGQTIIKDQGDK